MRGRLRLWLILSALTLAHASASALARNGYSFIDAARSATRYALAQPGRRLPVLTFRRCREEAAPLSLPRP